MSALTIAAIVAAGLVVVIGSIWLIVTTAERTYRDGEG
jgi:hypothetical protein